MLSTDDRMHPKLVSRRPSQIGKETSSPHIKISVREISRGAALVIGDGNETNASDASTGRTPTVDVVPVSRVQLQQLREHEDWLNAYVFGYMNYFALRILCSQLRSNLEAGMAHLSTKEYWSESGDALENILHDLIQFEGLPKLRTDVLIADPMATLHADLENAQKLIQKGAVGLRRKEQQDWLQDKSEQAARQLKKATDVLDRLVEYCKGCAIGKLGAVISATSMILPEVQIIPAPEETVKPMQSNAGLPITSQILATRNASTSNASASLPKENETHG